MAMRPPYLASPSLNATEGPLLMLSRHELQPTVDHVRGVRDVARARGGQPCDQRGHLAGVAGAAQRHVDLGGLLVLLAGHARRDLTGRNRVHPDAVLTELQ